VTGEDLKRMQDGFLETSKKLLLEQGHLQRVGFVITLHKHIDKFLESGWGIEFIDPKACLRDAKDDNSAALIVDLSMDWKQLYHAVLNVWPKTRDVLPAMIELGKDIDVDDAYKRVMRAFLRATEMEEKDVVAATMRQICAEANAFASVMHSEAWMRTIDTTSETVDDVYKKAPGGLGQDMKSVEVVYSSMETYDFSRLITVPIHREPSATRDDGKVIGFGEPIESEAREAGEGRLAGFLKPLGEAP
jgi:hypothetical protein